MMATYLSGDDVDALDGFEFLTMAEAGELGHWEIVKTMATKAKDRNLVRLADWATPIQHNHVEAGCTPSPQPAPTQGPKGARGVGGGGARPAPRRRPPGGGT